MTRSLAIVSADELTMGTIDGLIAAWLYDQELAISDDGSDLRRRADRVLGQLDLRASPSRRLAEALTAQFHARCVHGAELLRQFGETDPADEHQDGVQLPACVAMRDSLVVMDTFKLTCLAGPARRSFWLLLDAYAKLPRGKRREIRAYLQSWGADMEDAYEQFVARPRRCTRALEASMRRGEWLTEEQRRREGAK